VFGPVAISRSTGATASVRFRVQSNGRRGGVLLARTNGNGIITVVHRLRDGCTGETIDRRIAQLRPDGWSYSLFWKKGNGRWTAYYDGHGDPFVGSLAECLSEISRDPFNCYWT